MPRYVDMLKPADAEMYEQFRDDMGYKTANRFARECLRSYGKLKPRKQKTHWVNHYDDGIIFASSEYAKGKGKPRYPLPVLLPENAYASSETLHKLALLACWKD